MERIVIVSGCEVFSLSALKMVHFTLSLNFVANEMCTVVYIKVFESIVCLLQIF